MSWTMKAIYKDRNGYEYTTPVVKTANGWKLKTPLGDRDIEFYLMSADNSVIEFHEYRLQGPKGIRPVDYIQVLNAWLVQLPLPQRPAEPPKQTEPEDRRIHVDRRPGESNLAAAQRAYAENQNAAQRKA